MPTIISPLITDAGLAAVVAANAAGLQLALTHVAVGTGQYTPANNRVALEAKTEKVAIASGVVTGLGAMKINVLFPSWTGASYNVSEMGFFAGDPDSGGVLFAVYSAPARIIIQRNLVDWVAQLALQLTRVPVGSVTVTVDPSAAQSLALIAAHEVEVNPHPQYLMPRHSRYFYGQI